MSTQSWDVNAIPDQSGTLAVVTGATSGIGKETARVLADRRARVILAVRDAAKGESVAEELRRESPGADVAVRTLDLASLASIEAFAEAFLAAESRLDLLINNAGVMVPPYAKTEDGFELQFG
ncbi:MAG: SDR family NAD(P)-dependent oxidoreductase, partial [Caulobacterales bacterium]|nr:SDR family NAD(P)-dependent oxidoreductase [Caulobacterales bacterium]